MDDRIRVLFLSANPSDQAVLRSNAEWREIDKEIRSGDFGKRFSLIPSGATRPADLPDALTRYRPHIVHFSGHGSRGQGIIFENDYGNSLPADAQALTRLFSAFRENIRLIFLNTCYSTPQAEMLQQMFDYTIGTSDAVFDSDAIRFARSFYSTLANGDSVNKAMAAATFVLTVERTSAPIAELLTGKGVNADESFVEQLKSGTAKVVLGGQQNSERDNAANPRQTRKTDLRKKKGTLPSFNAPGVLNRMSKKHKGEEGN